MAMDDLRVVQTFYGIEVLKNPFSFGTLANETKRLVKNYISDACSTVSNSVATDINIFMFPHHIKKTYFIEGTIEGQITVAASGATSTVTSYQVSICKMHENNDDTILYTTGWKAVDDTLAWDAEYNVGEEAVYWFEIDAWEYEKLDQYERIYAKIEIKGSDNAVLMHSNAANWQDIYIDLPLRLG